MEHTFFLKGFKCFTGETFTLGNLTVLTGSNGTGKSSMIQALLLVRLAIEKNVLINSSSDYLESDWRGTPTPLNLGYELSLGTITDIFNDNENEGSNIILKLDNEVYEISLSDENGKTTSVNISLTASSIDVENLPFWRRKEFYYLFTERLGPRLFLASNYTNFPHCGHRGEYTAQVLLNNDFFKVDVRRHFTDSKSEYLPQQVDLWLDYICPGTTVRSEALGTMGAQIKLRNSSTKNPVLATNIGFGISYSLPIIVNGLIAKQNSVFIIENPEAHLHPKGQSNMGFFLGKIASSGVKIIIETHSEHIINGIRRALLLPKGLKSDAVRLYFFHGDKAGKTNVMPIKIEKNGDLSDFPVDFFDQVRQDLFDILRASNRK
ncbi:MAG: DUF3696 domain-containing protein [Sphingobacteriales bacterium]|nr:DUF3696 domain-containing protein [Sphingobacteriales bacterium]OJV98486.1 MAG: hypothetical protein BGO52_11925 [Sphingobacteriales bacterium 44-61]